MANFPTTFAEQPHRINPTEIPAYHAEPFLNLAKSGFVVVQGIERSDVADLTEISAQVDVLEFCPRDLSERWGDEGMVERQLAKDGGRGVFRLEHLVSGETAGFGWTGKASEEEAGYTGGENTFAVRINERFGGQGLAVPFTNAIVFGSMHFFKAKAIGWETWASNAKAVNSYVRAGALLTRAVASSRPTLDPSFPVATEGKYEGRHIRPDTRLYMKSPRSF